jgi:hypothetical protein
MAPIIAIGRPESAPAPDCFADLMAHWLDVAAESGMPIDARIWSQNPISSTYPACPAVKAAAEQDPVAAYRYLRRLREGLLIERFGRCATRELEELTGQPRPVLEAELWGLVRDWKLHPVDVSGATIWEAA